MAIPSRYLGPEPARMQHYSSDETEPFRPYDDWEKTFMYLEAMKPIVDLSVLPV